MAHLSKADWNKLKKAMSHYKGTPLRGVRWNPSADKKRWAKQQFGKKESHDDGAASAD